MNLEQNYWARLLAMAELAYSNAKNASTVTNPFESNGEFNIRVFSEEDGDARSKSKPAEIICQEFRDLLADCKRNLRRAQEKIPLLCHQANLDCCRLPEKLLREYNPSRD